MTFVVGNEVSLSQCVSEAAIVVSRRSNGTTEPIIYLYTRVPSLVLLYHIGRSAARLVQ